MKIVNWKAILIYTIGCSICMVGGYLAGHTACAHQHVAVSEQNRMLRNKEGGWPDTKAYIINAFKDYGKMIQDPLGLGREDWLD